MNHTRRDAGFSLIELLVVVAIIGVIAAISITYLVKAKTAAENTSAIAVLSVVRNAQMTFVSQKGRYGKLDELKQSYGFAGDLENPTVMRRGAFKFELTSDVALLNTQYTILATRERDNQIPVIYSLDQSGVITGISQ